MQGTRSDSLATRRRYRAIVGLIGIGLALGYAVQTVTTLSFGQAERPGEAVFPIVVAGIMLLASLALVWEQVSRPGGMADGPLELPRGLDRRRLVGTGLSYVGYVALVPFLGHLLASFLLALALARLLKPASWRRTALVALAISVSSYLLFVLILEVPLPKGILG